MATSDVINWDEAMEQVGDDEEFLRELLGDFRSEVEAQLVKIDEALRAHALTVSESCRLFYFQCVTVTRSNPGFL